MAVLQNSLLPFLSRLVLIVVLVLGCLGSVDGAGFSVSEAEKVEVKSGEGQRQVRAWEKFYDLGYTYLRKNANALKAYQDAIDEGLDGLDAIQDAIQTLQKQRWDEIKALFKRGNDFNRKARDGGWYPFHEIHLANGKRLD